MHKSYTYYVLVSLLALRSLIIRFLLTGVPADPISADPYYRDSQVYEVIAGNLFDGDMGYNMVGFVDNITVNLPTMVLHLIYVLN